MFCDVTIPSVYGGGHAQKNVEMRLVVLSRVRFFHSRSLNIAIIALLTLAFFQPRILQTGALASVSSIVTCIAIALASVIYFWRVHIDLIGGLAIGYLGAMLLSCFINGGSLEYMSYTFQTYGLLSASILFAVAVMPSYGRELLWCIVVIAGFYTIANLFVLLVVPVGESALRPEGNFTFLAYRNSFCRFYFPALCASLLLDQEHDKPYSVRTIVLLLASVAQSLISYSATSMLALCIFVVCVALSSMGNMRKILNARTFLCTYAVLFVGIVLLRLQNVLSNGIAAIGRDITFTGRTEIWDIALSFVNPEHFLFGYNGTVADAFPVGWRMGVAHNAVLDIMYWGGIIGLGLFSALVIAASVRLYRQRSTRAAAILSIYLGVFLLMGLMEFITCVPFFLFIGIAWSWKGLSRQKSSKMGKHAAL